MNNLENIKVDWNYIYDWLKKHNPGCTKKDFVETMEEIKEEIIFENEEDFERYKEEMKRYQ